MSWENAPESGVAVVALDAELGQPPRLVGADHTQRRAGANSPACESALQPAQLFDLLVAARKPLVDEPNESRRFRRLARASSTCSARHGQPADVGLKWPYWLQNAQSSRSGRPWRPDAAATDALALKVLANRGPVEQGLEVIVSRPASHSAARGWRACRRGSGHPFDSCLRSFFILEKQTPPGTGIALVRPRSATRKRCPDERAITSREARAARRRPLKGPEINC